MRESFKVHMECKNNSTLYNPEVLNKQNIEVNTRETGRIGVKKVGTGDYWWKDKRKRQLSSQNLMYN